MLAPDANKPHQGSKAINRPFPSYPCFKTSPRANIKMQEFDLNENEPVGEIHIHMNGFAQCKISF